MAVALMPSTVDTIATPEDCARFTDDGRLIDCAIITARATVVVRIGMMVVTPIVNGRPDIHAREVMDRAAFDRRFEKEDR